ALCSSPFTRWEGCMTPLVFPLIAFISGILASPWLDPRPIWWCLPIGVLLFFARRWCVVIPLFLLGAGLRSWEPPTPPDPGSDPSRVVGRLTGPPEWRGVGVYLDIRLDTVDGKPYSGRARLTEFL